MSEIFWEIAVILVLVVVNGFFAMSELALVSSRRSRLKQLADEGRRGARVAIELAGDPSRMLSTVQIGITSIGILAGAYSGATLASHIEAWLRQVPALAGIAETLAIVVVVVGITFLSLIVGELVPKRVALNNADAIASAVAIPMKFLSRLAAPAVWFLGWVTEMALRLLGQPSRAAVTVTQDEIRTMIAEGTDAGVFDTAERDMIEGVLRLADRPLRSIMTPRPDVEWLDLGDGEDVLRRRIAASDYSRFPVGRGDVDAVEGVVDTKHLLDRLLRNEPFDLKACLVRPPFMHEGASILKLIEVFRSEPTHMAIVVDEYGSIQGIVTPTDILAAIAGEFSEGEAAAEPGIVRREDGSWLIDGMTDMHEVERLLGRRGMAADDDYHTLAGFVLWQFGHLPKTGEWFEWRDLRFEVVDMDGRRIDRILVTPPADRPDPGEA
jgi:putative hemolysin